MNDPIPKGVWYSIGVKPTREDPRRDPSVLHSEHRVTQVSPGPRYTVEVDLLSTGAIKTGVILNPTLERTKLIKREPLGSWDTQPLR